MNATQPAPSPPPTPTIEQQVGPYVSGKGYLQQPNSPYVGYPPSGGSCLHHPLLLMAGGKPVVGIPQIGNQPYYSPPYPGMASSVWKPTFPIQPGSFWDRLLNPQPVPSSSQIPTYQSVPQQAQIHVSQPLPFIASQPIPSMVSGTPRFHLLNLYKVPYLLNRLHKVLLKFQ
jgi:hypothetical protein